MSNTSTFPLPLEGLELPRFLLLLDETLAQLPGARLTYVEMDALLADDPATVNIHITMAQPLVESLRAPGDPELPDEDALWDAEFTLVDDGEQTTLNVDLERNVFVMPVIVKIVEDLLQRVGASNSDDDDDEDEDEEFDDEDEDEEFDEDDDIDDEEDEEDDDTDEEFDDDDTEEDDGEFDDESDGWDGVAAFEVVRQFAANTFGEANRDGETAFVFPVKWEDPPAQKLVRVRGFVPTVAMGQGEQLSWIALECEVCPREKLAPEIAVSLNTEVDFTLSLDGDTYLMSQSLALRSVDASLFVDMALALAEQADMLNSAIEQGILEKA